MRKVVLLLLFAFPAVASAGWINKAGESLPESNDRKSNGDFGAHMIFVADEDELFKRWSTPGKSVDVKTIDQVQVNGSINAFVIFSGCKPDATGNCSVAMTFRVVQPDGKVYAETPPMEVWSDKPAPRGRSLELSVQYLKIVIEPSDQLGKYVISTQVRDNNSGKVLKLVGPFTAAKAK